MGQGTLGNQKTLSIPSSKGKQGIEVKKRQRQLEPIYLFDDFARTFPNVRGGNGPREELMGWTFEAHHAVVGTGLLFACHVFNLEA